MAGSPARREVGRVGVKVVPDTSKFGEQLRAELARWEDADLNIDIEADLAEFEAQLERALHGRTAEVKIDLDTAQAEARLAEFLRSRDLEVKVQLNEGTSRARIEELTRDASKKINIDLDTASARAKIRRLVRTETKQIKVDVDKSSLDQVQGVISGIGSGLTSVFKGVSDGVSSAVKGVSQLGDAGTEAIGAISDASGGLTKVLSNVPALIGSAITGVAQLAGAAVVLTSIVSLLGAIVSAAGAAAIALGGLLIGAGALIALPAILTGVMYAFFQSSKDLQKEWEEVTGKFTEAFKNALNPSLDKFGELANKAADALQKGNPFYDAFTRALNESIKALEPLAKGLADFATNTLRGMGDALANLNKSGFFQQIQKGFQDLGTALGDFFKILSEHSPVFAEGFNAIGDAMKKMLPSLANLSAAFAEFAPEVLDGIAEAVKRLFDAFAANKDVYATAAISFANALRDMAPGLEAVAAAFAKMAPSVLSAIAQAVNSFAEALSDPEVIQGLTTLAETLVNLGARAAEVALDMSANVGKALDSIATRWDIDMGVIQESSRVTNEHLKGLVQQADSTREAAINLQKQIGVSMDAAYREATGTIWKMASEWQTKIDEMVEKGQTGSAQINQTFRDRFEELRRDWASHGGHLTAEWKSKLEQLVKDTQASTDPTVAAMGKTMQGVLDQVKTKGDATVEQVRQMLAQMEDKAKAAQIAEILGLEMDATKQKVTDGVTQAQQAFSKLPEVMRQLITSSKTPEEVGTKLDQMNKVIGEKSAQGAKEFARLPEGMAKAIAKDQISTQVKSIMDKVIKSVNDGVARTKEAWSKLPKAMSDAVIADSSVVSSVTNQMTKVQQAITTGVQSSVTAWKRLQTDTNAAAVADKTPATVKQKMDEVVKTITSSVTKGIAEFKKLSDQAANYGKLSGFTSAINNAMSSALSTVTSYVSRMINELSKLNRTFQGPKITAPQQVGGSGGGSVGPSSVEGVSLMTVPAEPVLLAAEAAPSTMAAASTLAQSIGGYASALTSARTSTPATSGTTPQKVYNITVNAAPNVPTEEQLRKQLEYADTLYS